MKTLYKKKEGRYTSDSFGEVIPPIRRVMQWKWGGCNGIFVIVVTFLSLLHSSDGTH